MGGGEVLYYLSNSGIKAIGLESDIAEYNYVTSLGLDVRKKFIDTENEDTDITKLLKSVDVVSFFNVLEHIELPRKYIDYISANMKSGAFMVLEVPKHPSLGSFANLTSLDNIYRHIVPPIHLQVFSENSLRLLLEKDFDIIATWEFGQGFTDIINNAMILSGLEQSTIYDTILRAQTDIQRAVDIAGLSDQIMIVARKKEVVMSGMPQNKQDKWY